MKWSPTWSSVFFWSVIHQSIILLPPISFAYYRVKSHFLSNKRNLPTINLHLFACLISFTVCNQSAISVALPTPFNKFFLSSRDPSCRNLLTLLGLLYYTTWHIFLSFYGHPHPPARHWHTLLDHCHVNKVLLTPNHLSRAWAQTPTPHCFLHSPTECIIMVGLWHPLLGINPFVFCPSLK